MGGIHKQKKQTDRHRLDAATLKIRQCAENLGIENLPALLVENRKVGEGAADIDASSVAGHGSVLPLAWFIA